MSRRLIGLLLLLPALAIGVCALGAWWILRHQPVEYARDATGLSLSETEALEICDDIDWSVGYYLHPSAEDARQITERGQPLSETAYESTSLLVNSQCLPRPLDESRLTYASGCSRDQAWVALLDSETNELWLEVGSADMSGDGPGCPPST